MQISRGCFQALMKWVMPLKTEFSHNKRLLSSNRKSSDGDLPVYTAEQQLIIIDTLHKCVKNNITRTHLNEKKLQSIRLLFEQNQNLKSLEPLLTINGFGPRLLHKICDSILQDPLEIGAEEETESQDDKDQSKLRLPSGLVTPAHISQTTLGSVVSITLGVNAVSWARLQVSNSELDVWDIVDISSWAEKKYDVHSVTDMIMDLREKVPDGDIYVLENSNWSNVASIKKPMKYHIQEAMLTTAICSVFNLIDADRSQKFELNNRVYFLRSHTPFRLFHKIVGSERVSVEDIIQNMMNSVPDVRHRQINFSAGVTDRYRVLNGSMRNNMCHAALLVVSFTELILLRNLSALSNISRTANVKKNKKS